MTEHVPAQVGLELALGTRGAGLVVELLPHGAVVELGEGAIAVVPWGQVVSRDGRPFLLQPP